MADRKPLALLIPGLDGTGRFYEPHLAAIERTHRALPWRFHPPPGFTYGDLVAELAAATDGEPPHSVAVVGESFGGTVALQFTLAFQERVRRLVLVNTFPHYRRRVRIRLACRLCPLLKVVGIRQLKSYLSDRLLEMEGVDERGIRHYRDVVREIDMGHYRRRLELVRDIALQERLSEIRAPTTILASGRDKVVPSATEGRFMASRIPGARLHEFPSAGHALLLTPGFSLAAYL